MPSNDLEYAMELGARVTRAALGLGAHLALAPVRLALRKVMPPPPEPRWSPIDDPRVPDQRAPAPDQRAPAPEPPVVTTPVPPVPDPADADATIVASAGPSADPGPEIHIAPPWPGYDDMNVAAVVARCRDANPTVVMMVRLYEETHKNRRGVLQATGG
jgi:hypothetical protein